MNYFFLSKVIISVVSKRYFIIGLSEKTKLYKKGRQSKQGFHKSE